MSVKSNELLKALGENRTSEALFKMATVTRVVNSHPLLQFYGEETNSEKEYRQLSSYSPSVGDVVCLAKIGNSWLVLGKII